MLNLPRFLFLEGNYSSRNFPYLKRWILYFTLCINYRNTWLYSGNLSSQYFPVQPFNFSKWSDTLQNSRIVRVTRLYTHFFYKQHFCKQRQAKIGKKLSKCLATPWAWTFAIWKLLAKKVRRYSKKCTKYKCVNDVIWLMIIKMRLSMKNKSQRYSLNRSRPRYGHKYTKYKCLSVQWWLYKISNT